MQIDPRLSFAFNLLLMIVSGIATGAVHFTGLVSDPVAKAIIGWAGVATFILSSVNTALHGYSASGAGPFVAHVQKPMPPLSGKIEVWVAAALIGATLFAIVPQPADAKAISTTKASLATPDQIVAKILQWVATDGNADLATAITLAKASNDTVTLPCWTALQSFAKEIASLPPADQLPKLHLATDVEIATDLMIALEPNSPVVAQCQALANFQKMTAVNMVTGILTGALSIGKLAPILP